MPKFQTTFHHGLLLNHRPIMASLQEKRVNGVEFSALLNDQKNSSWQQEYNFPDAGISVTYWDLGNPERLGKGISLIPFIDFPVSRNVRSVLNIRFGWGIGFIEKSFDAYQNYKNIAIGSALNNALVLQPNYRFRLNDQSTLGLGVSISHFSNGSYASPNLGLNLGCMTASLEFSPQPAHPLPLRSRIKFEKQSQTLVFGSFALKEVAPADGIKYPATTISGTRFWKKNRKTSLGAGADIFYDQSLKTRFDNGASSFKDLIRAGIHGGAEMQIARIFLNLHMGVYLYQTTKSETFYHRFGIRYQINKSIFVCSNVKSHWGKADYMEFGLGVRLNKSHPVIE